ncbi:Probable Fe(2+)-trafficking protein [Bordetella hinzii]|nr:putative Fe(2+)-trafficking protein [Bordetella hinzii]KCB21681.1 putative Fe(2+)-trafficking protein [Bordetella hinzii OH87 BAL007II]KCB21718.1 putative Fe(2+)-trafficking protein [Bordetella hinzii L60]KCB32306.1 putative Fe(2+)-trafficking protein [Bordetella hinzii CA90 BAL1384]KCB40385.1 putative Fe(2+)-trafficking protein [Bordetella hinzii 5132]KCB48973.1 putative Fe(2+)-trafficking protein [Bordetella hinzii 4161]KCB52612.1 putative Fe(2+)-trafficking protein [Bordetella hinzii 12
MGHSKLIGSRKMARTVNCVKLKREAEGLDFPPYPGELGARIWREVSKEAWEEWKQVQTRLVNENRLNLADARARKYLQQQMERFLFEDGTVEAQGYVPPSA